MTSQGAHSSATAASPKPKSRTFWAVCHVCKMQYEYLRIYLSHNLMCPNCYEPFLADETAPTHSNMSKPPSSWIFTGKKSSSSHQVSGKSNYAIGKDNMENPHIESRRFSSIGFNKQNNFQGIPFSNNDGVSTAAEAASMVHETYAKVKRTREEAQPASKWNEASQKKKQVSKNSEVSSSGHRHPCKKRRCTKNTNMSNKGQKCVQPGLVDASNTKVDIPRLLVEKARTEILMRLESDMSSTAAAKTTVEEGGNGHHTANESVGKGLGRFDGFVKKKLGNLKNEVSRDVTKVMSVDVPDPDFYNFDNRRTERLFVENEVWAAYDKDDGMPRYYAFIHTVFSLTPFKVLISWLNSMADSGFANLNWSLSGIKKTTGHFIIGRSEISNSLDSFSHKVKWRKDIGGSICIYPRRGDVWAFYRNWSSDWNELTAVDMIHKYEMVEVLEGYTQEHGVTVIPLVKVADFKTVFHRHLNMREMKRIPREEMRRFSHCVPARWLTGQEAPNAPRGCWELDPAATPSELLQIIRHVEEDDLVGLGEGIQNKLL